MGDFLGMITEMLKEELEKEEYQQKITQWFLRHILPYVIVIIAINFFMTIGAVSLVLYVRNLYST